MGHDQSAFSTPPMSLGLPSMLYARAIPDHDDEDE